MSTATDNLRREQAALLNALQNAGADVSNPRRIRCPFHDDQHASAGVFAGDDGAWRFKCHSCGAGGDVFDILARVQQRPVADVLREVTGADRRSTRPRVDARPPKRFAKSDELIAAFPAAQACYVYTHPTTGHADLIVLRLPNGKGGKRCVQAHDDGSGIVLTAPPKPWPLYNRTRVAASQDVVIVEGEKCVHALHQAGIVATTSPGGAGKSGLADWSPLAGKRLWLWPDNDELGVAHMREVMAIVERLDPPPIVHWIDPSTLDLPPKGDAADLVEQFSGEPGVLADVLADVLGEATRAGAAQDVGDHIERIISGTHRAIGWPWPAMESLTRALLPGTVSLLCGDAGDGKSFLLLQALAYWQSEGTPACVFELEEDRTYHLARALAQAEQNSHLTDPEWIANNADAAREVHWRHRDMLDALGRCVWDAPARQVTLSDLTDWARDRAKDGYRVIAIDPVTAAEQPERQWQADAKFILDVKAIARDSGASLVLVTHPKKGRQKQIGTDVLAGGAAFARFSQTVLWMERHEPPKDVTITGAFGSRVESINRSLHLLKTRNGRGHGLSIGYTFDSETLRFTEQGLIRGDDG